MKQCSERQLVARKMTKIPFHFVSAKEFIGRKSNFGHFSMKTEITFDQIDL